MERFVTFVNNINLIYRCVQKIKNNEMTEFGLKGMHVMCMFHLNHSKTALTAARLSVLCGEDKAAISRAVADLAAKGLIDFTDRESQLKYRAPITLTPQGIEVADRMDSIIEFVVDKGGNGLTDEERAGFYKALELIADNLKTFISEE